MEHRFCKKEKERGVLPVLQFSFLVASPFLLLRLIEREKKKERERDVFAHFRVF